MCVTERLSHGSDQKEQAAASQNLVNEPQEGTAHFSEFFPKSNKVHERGFGGEENATVTSSRDSSNRDGFATLAPPDR